MLFPTCRIDNFTSFMAEFFRETLRRVPKASNDHYFVLVYKMRSFVNSSAFYPSTCVGGRQLFAYLDMRLYRANNEARH